MTPVHPALAGGPSYLDYNATTPVDPRVTELLWPYLTNHFGNPSSAHHFSGAAADGLRRSREQVAALIGANPDGVVFTGSGSEANNLALRGAVLAARTDRPHLITQATEHPAVLATCRALQRQHGVEVTCLAVDGQGLVDPDDLAAAITTRTVLVSIMLANNETGTIQPVAELVRVARDHGVAFHTDAAQAAGKIPVDVTGLGVDLLTVVGHKMYAPKGIAALWVRPGLDLEPVIYGGGQERGLRAGTENVAFAVALGAAADLARADLAAGEPDRVRGLRDRLHHGLAERLPDRVLLNGHPTKRLPNTANLALLPHRGDDILSAASGVAASTGSACHTGETEPSPVLTAMALPAERARSAVRLSLGRWSTLDDVELATAAL
ncbi:MAG TPA: cysteine desulfurase family protein, partial [Micromonosporaceae bacterium]